LRRGRFGICSLYLLIAVLLLLVMPLDHGSVMLVLFVAADLGAAALMLRPDAVPASTPAAIAVDAAALALYRRTLPELRIRRPAVTIEAQTRWRQQAERHRRLREMF
jgi:hypothetical protein